MEIAYGYIGKSTLTVPELLILCAMIAIIIGWVLWMIFTGEGDEEEG